MEVALRTGKQLVLKVKEKKRTAVLQKSRTLILKEFKTNPTSIGLGMPGSGATRAFQRNS